MKFKESVNFGYSDKEKQQILQWIEDGLLFGDDVEADLSWKSQVDFPEAQCIGKGLSPEELALICQYNKDSEEAFLLLSYEEEDREAYYPVIGQDGTIDCLFDPLEMPLCANMLENLMSIAREFPFLEMVVVLFSFEIENPPKELSKQPQKILEYLDFGFHISKGKLQLMSKAKEITEAIRLYDAEYGTQ